MTTLDRPILILGAGINGVALARELLLSGVPVCLVDAADIASGATSYSSRLIHGGLRYLEYGEFDLVQESLAERTRLLKLAPQFVRPLRLFIPVEHRWGGLARAARQFLTGKSPANSPRPGSRGRYLVQLGLRLYDTYAHDEQLPHRDLHTVGADGTPQVDAARYRWLCSYWDAQVLYPQRLTLAMLEDTRRMAAKERIWLKIYTYHQARLNGRTVQIVRTSLSGSGAAEAGPVAHFEPAAIINATGAWVDRTLQRLPVSAPRLIGPTKGSHLVTYHRGLAEQLEHGGIYAEAADGRPVFLLPMGTGDGPCATLIGTTDLPFDAPPEDAVASDSEIQYLLGAVNHVFPNLKLNEQDVHLHYSGVRPLPYVGEQTPAAITRRHWIEEHSDTALPVFSVIGGKLTTCRSLAQETAQTVLARLGTRPRGSSEDRPLPGGESYPDNDADVAAEQERLSQHFDCPPGQIRTLWKLYGTRVKEILSEISETGSRSTPGDGNLAGTSFPLKFIRWVIRHEWVTTLSDLVERRLMLLYEPRLSEYTLRRLARLLIEEGLLDEGQIDAEVNSCSNRLRAHFGKQLTAMPN